MPVGTYTLSLTRDGVEIFSENNVFVDYWLAEFSYSVPLIFGSAQIISTSAGYPTSVYSIDMDGDGDIDVLSASANDAKIAWYENLK